MLPRPGSSFGRYDVGRRLGQGGMGVVFAAVHRDLGRDVALKLLAPDLSEDQAYRNRFLREARALARLDSPNIVRVHDAGEEDGWLFIATELVPDGDLNQLLAEGGLPLAVASDLVAQVARGLHDAHEEGVLHRDIKPSNVLLRRQRDGRLSAILCDLGISAVQDAEHTMTVGVIGTPRYMAPERHEGAEASVASDVYSLGCLLWAAVTGRAPYEGTASQILLGHLHGDVPQLPGDTALERTINTALARSMAKRPEDRYTSAAEFMAALRSDIDTEPAGATLLRPPAATRTVPAAATVAQAMAPTVVGPADPRPATAPNRSRHTPPPSPVKVKIVPDRPRRPRRRVVLVSAAVVAIAALIVGAAVLLNLDGAKSVSPVTVTPRRDAYFVTFRFSSTEDGRPDSVRYQVVSNGRRQMLQTDFTASSSKKVCIRVRAIATYGGSDVSGPWTSRCA